MSAVIPQALSKVLVVDPMCDFQSEAVYAVEKSTSNSNYYNITSNNSSIQSTTWTVNCNDNTTITDRLFLMDIQFELTIPLNGAVYTANKALSLRSFPLLKWSNNYVLTLGNGTCTLQSGEIANLIERYGFMDKYLNYGTFPNYLDNDQPYQNTTVFANPFAGSVSLEVEKCLKRGSFAPIGFNKDAVNNTLTVSYRVVEPVFLSPLLQSMSIKARKEGMTKLSQIQFTVNWGHVNRLISTSDILAGAPTVKMVEGKSILRVVQYVPSTIDIGRNINTQALPYNEIVSFNTDPINLALRADNTTRVSVPRAGFPAVSTFNSAVIQLSRIPKELYIFCRPSNSVYQTPTLGTQCVDNFAVYQSQSLRVNFNGQNLLTSISDVNLYRICVENGCNIPWQMWSGSLVADPSYADNIPKYGAGVGSPICLKFGKDIVLPPELAPGTLSKCNLQVSADFASSCIKGTAGTLYAVDALPYSLYMTIVYEGVIEFYGSGGTVAQTLGALTVNDVLETSKRNERVHYDIVNDGTFGGAMMSNAKNFVKGKAHSLMSKMKGLMNNPAVSPQLSEAVEAMVGRGMSGGKSMSKASLKRALLG
jgi:hypothetical protein